MIIMADSGLPPTVAVAVAVGLIAITAGYFLGQASSLGIFHQSGNPSQHSRRAKSWPNSYEVTIHPDSSDEDLMAQQRAGAAAQAEDSESDEEGDGEGLKSFATNTEQVKLVLAVRTDLGMGQGEKRPTTTTHGADVHLSSY